MLDLTQDAALATDRKLDTDACLREDAGEFQFTVYEYPQVVIFRQQGNKCMKIITCLLVDGLIHYFLPVAIEHNILQVTVIELALLADALLDDRRYKRSQFNAF